MPNKVYLISNKHVLAGAASIAITFTKSKDREWYFIK